MLPMNAVASSHLETAQVQEAPAAPCRIRPWRRLAFVLASLGLAGFFFGCAVLLGHRLLLSGHMWTDATLFGNDAARNIRTMSAPGWDERSNVHPLLGVTVKPVAYLIQRLGITPATSAIIVNAAAGMLGLLLTALYFRLREVSRRGSLLGLLLMASSATWLLASPIPGTYIFHVWVVAALNLVLIWSVRQPALPGQGRRWLRPGLWLGLGVLNYGYTVTCGIFGVFAYGFSRTGRRRWLAAVVYGATVLALGIFLSWLAGSSLNMWLERRWVVDNQFHGTGQSHPFLESLSCNLVWTVVTPGLVDGTMPDGRVIKTILNWSYSPGGWLLAACWGAVLLAAAAALWAEREPEGRRLNGALVACLIFQIAFHSFYYVTGEGVFNYCGHVLFPLFGLLAPLLGRIDRMAPVRSRALYTALGLFALVLAARHMQMCHDFVFTIPLPK